MEEALYLNDSQRAIIAAHGNRPGAALKNHLRDASIEASLLISVSKASFPPGRPVGR